MINLISVVILGLISHETTLKILIPEVVFLIVLNVKGSVVGPGVVVVKQGYMFLVTVPSASHSATMQFPRPSVVL